MQYFNYYIRDKASQFWQCVKKGGCSQSEVRICHVNVN